MIMVYAVDCIAFINYNTYDVLYIGVNIKTRFTLAIWEFHYDLYSFVAALLLYFSFLLLPFRLITIHSFIDISYPFILIVAIIPTLSSAISIVYQCPSTQEYHQYGIITL
jgi:hypothetical protein